MPTIPSVYRLEVGVTNQKFSISNIRQLEQTINQVAVSYLANTYKQAELKAMRQQTKEDDVRNIAALIMPSQQDWKALLTFCQFHQDFLTKNPKYSSSPLIGIYTNIYHFIIKAVREDWNRLISLALQEHQES